MIYCLEDDASIRELIIYTLKSSDFEACGFESSKELFNALDRQIPELIILDIMLPDMDGLEIIKKLKSSEKYKEIPVIFATAKTSESDKVIGLNLGADDYLSKPFGMLEMVARVKAILRRDKRNKPEDTITFKEIEMNKLKRSVKVNGKEIDLTQKEFNLLQCLIENPEIVFSRERLLDKIWGEDYLGESRTIDVHIGTLRSKLLDAGAYIHTVHGVGYCIRDLNNG